MKLKDRINKFQKERQARIRKICAALHISEREYARRDVAIHLTYWREMCQSRWISTPLMPDKRLAVRRRSGAAELPWRLEGRQDLLIFDDPQIDLTAQERGAPEFAEIARPEGRSVCTRGVLKPTDRASSRVRPLPHGGLGLHVPRNDDLPHRRAAATAGGMAFKSGEIR